MGTCRLVKRGWLYRGWAIHTDDGSFHVEYHGRGKGHEAVTVIGPQGKSAFKLRSLIWFAPRFEFEVGSLLASLEITVHPWMTFSKVELTIGDELVYVEGAGAPGIGATAVGNLPVPATAGEPLADSLPLPAGEPLSESA
ncbi:MAG: hypothetical protein K0Q72_1034 [Armatimonadetes bacterium]|nr:hypothetical protein [Armatimonadota bacterium]